MILRTISRSKEAKRWGESGFENMMTARPRRENPSNGSRSPLTLLEQVKARAKARPKLVRVADVMEMAGSLKGFRTSR